MTVSWLKSILTAHHFSMLGKKKILTEWILLGRIFIFWLLPKDQNSHTLLDSSLNKSFFLIFLFCHFHQISIFLFHSSRYFTESVWKKKGYTNTIPNGKLVQHWLTLANSTIASQTWVLRTTEGWDGSLVRKSCFDHFVHN